MAYGQGIQKTLAVAKQVAKGTAAAVGSGAQYLRRISFTPSASRATYVNNEIVTHQQSTGVAYGLKTVAGKLSGLLSPGTYKLFIASILRKDFVAGVTTGVLATITSAVISLGIITLTRSAGSFLTDGFKIGDVVRVTGFATTGTANNSRNAIITALTATVMTLRFIDGLAGGAKAAGDNVTIAVQGKKTLAPLTGHTNDYFTLEDWYSDIAQSELFVDMKVSQIDIGSPASGNVTIAVDFLGLARNRSQAQVLSDASAASGTDVTSALNGLIFVNGVATASVTGAQLSIVGNLAQGDAVIGSNSPVDIARGRINVTGQFTALFDTNTIADFYDNQTVISLVLFMAINASNPISDFVCFNMGAIKLTGDAPDDGEKLIIRTYPFTAQFNSTGGAALAYDQTILSIQDSAA
jgi:hypothetical protein